MSEQPEEKHPESPTPEETTEEAVKTTEAAEEASTPEEAQPEAEAEEAKAEEAAPEAEAKAEEAAPEAEAKAEEAKAEEAAPEAEAKAEEAKAEEAAPEAEAKAEEAKAEEAAPEAEAKAEEAAPAAEAAPSEEESAEKKAADAEQAAKEAALSAELEELQAAMEAKKAVEGQVIGWNKGGYHVALGRVAAFCPVSQIEIGSPRNPKRYLDKTFKFNVIEIQRSGRRVVVSRATALKAEKEARAALVRERLSPGQEIEGKVTSITDFGAFVDLGGGIEGLVHVSEISRQRVEHAREKVQIGQEVKVVVLKIEKGGERISLSMKRLEADPWKKIAETYPPGTKFTGKIMRKAEFGIFVEIESGIEGLLHNSRLTLGLDPSDESLAEGNEIEGWIQEVEPRRRRMSLSMREVVSGNPWKEIEERFPVGEVAKGTIERVAKFGVFVELEPGLTGLLPFSTLSSPPSGNPKRQFPAGKEIDVRVLSIDTEKKRISLGTESSKAEGSSVDYREYKKKQSQGSGMNAMAAAFARLQGDN